MKQGSEETEYVATEPAHVFLLEWYGVHSDAYTYIGSVLDAVSDDPDRQQLCKRGFRVWHRGKADEDGCWYVMVLEGDADYLEHVHPLIVKQLEQSASYFDDSVETLAGVRKDFPGLIVLASIGVGGQTFEVVDRNVHLVDDGGIDSCMRRFFRKATTARETADVPTSPSYLGDRDT